MTERHIEAGAELCQVQIQVVLPADVNVKKNYLQILASLEKTHNMYMNAIYVIFQRGHYPLFQNFQQCFKLGN